MMRSAKLTLVVCLLFVGLADVWGAHNNPGASDDDTYAYIDRYKHLAIRDMYRYGIPASVTMAQAILESGHGQSSLSQRTNNHFGIKCHENWSGETYYHKDDDLDNRGNLTESCFRQYGSVEESFRDHSEFLRFRSYYQELFKLPRNNYKAWCQGLKKAGYATLSDYDKKLIGIIEKYHLYLLDEAPYTEDFKRLMPRPFRSAYLQAPVWGVGEVLDDYQNYEASSSAELVLRDEPEQLLVERNYPRYESPEAAQVPAAGLAPTAWVADPLGQRQLPVLREDSLISYYLGVPQRGPKRFTFNGLDAVRVGRSDTWETLSDDYGVPASKLAKYNGLSPKSPLKAGWIVYLEPKENRVGAMLPLVHVVKAGETVVEIAQKYALSISELRKLNRLGKGLEPAAGAVLYLSKASPEKTVAVSPAEKMLERKGALERLFGLK